MTREKQKRVPVFAGNRIIELCDQVRAACLGRARNVALIRSKGEIQKVLIAEVPVEESDLPSDGPSLTYEEALVCGSIVVLKRYDPRAGFVRWSRRDSFNPKRFNPDSIPEPLIQTRARHRQ